MGIIVLIVGLVACGLIVLRISIDNNYGRANRVGDKIIEYIEPLYKQVQDLIPDGAVLIEAQEPISGTFAYGLSDGSTRYAFVEGQQIYASSANLDEIVTHYDRLFVEAEWVSVPLTSWVDRIDSAYHHPLEDGLIVGVCEAQKLSDQRYTIGYSVYFYYQETGCINEMSQGDPLYCIAHSFCKETS